MDIVVPEDDLQTFLGNCRCEVVYDRQSRSLSQFESVPRSISLVSRGADSGEHHIQERWCTAFIAAYHHAQLPQFSCLPLCAATQFLFSMDQSIFNYARTFKLVYSLCFLQAIMRNISCEMAASSFIQDESLTLGLPYIRIASLLLKNTARLKLL